MLPIPVTRDSEPICTAAEKDGDQSVLLPFKDRFLDFMWEVLFSFFFERIDLDFDAAGEVNCLLKNPKTRAYRISGRNQKNLYGFEMSLFKGFALIQNHRGHYYPCYINIYSKQGIEGFAYVPRCSSADFCRHLSKNNDQPDASSVVLYSKGFTSRLGYIKHQSLSLLHNTKEIKETLESVSDVLLNKKENVGILLYGPPGNGKSHFARFLSSKFKIPLNVRILSGISEAEFIQTFDTELTIQSKIHCFDDFDIHFDGRVNTSKDSTISFSTILNLLDGNLLLTKGQIFVFTVNDINKIDSALLDRPSRIKHVIHFQNPDQKMRERIFLGCGEEASVLVEKTAGFNLDQCLAERSRLREMRG